MKKIAIFLMIVILTLCLAGCNAPACGQIAATTAPVWEFTSALCEGTPLTVSRLVTENVSCLHDYSLTVRQMKLVEQCDVVVISGAGLEEFMADLLNSKSVIDASRNVSLLEMGSHEHHEEENHEHGHHHAHDPHIWLSPANGLLMAQTICEELSNLYPDYSQTFQENLSTLAVQFDDLQTYGERELSDLSCDHLITFHDGFGYLADAFDLHILKAIEEESGSEASAHELIELISLVRDHHLPAVFTEVNGSPAAASVICAETGIDSFALDMAMGGASYFDSMYHNIDTLKEALQ